MGLRRPGRRKTVGPTGPTPGPGDGREHLRTDQYADDSNLATRGSFNRRFSDRDDDPSEWLLARLRRDLSPDADLLEVGCGRGALWESGAPPGWTTLLTDFSPGMVRATAATAAAEPAHRFGVADAARLSLRTGSVDAVVANMMLYHVPERRTALREIRRVLQPGGRLYATTVPADRKRRRYELMDTVADGPVEPLAGEFTAETAGAELGAVFEGVERDTYESELAVTDADALVEYVRTLPDAPELDGFEPSDLPALRTAAERRLSDGPIRLNADIALFVARRE